MSATRLSSFWPPPPLIQLLSCTPGLIHYYHFGWALPAHLVCFTFVYMCLFLSSPEGQAEADTPDKEASSQPESNDETTSS